MNVTHDMTPNIDHASQMKYNQPYPNDYSQPYPFN